MGKDGRWTHGTDELEVYEESEWAVNPFSFATGYSAFDKDGNRVGEEMRAMREPPMLKADLPPVNGKWSEQIGFGLKCLNTEDAGLEGLAYQRSRGGLESAKKLLHAVLDRANNGHQDCVPVVTLSNEWYKHSKYGKIYKPVFTVLRWVDMIGEDGQEAVPEAEPEVLEAEPEVLEAPKAEEEEDAPASTRRRRRRV